MIKSIIKDFEILIFINALYLQITKYHKFYGITQDLETKNYMMVLKYAEDGSLRNYLDKNYDKLTWKAKFYDLWYVAYGLHTFIKMN